MAEKACEECGKTFTYKPSQDRKCCSATCAGIRRARQLKAEGRLLMPTKPRRGTETPCEVCGKPVYANKSQREKGEGRYCSVACRVVGQGANKVSKPCVVCGKMMVKSASQAYLQTCSMECQAARRTKRPLERLHNGKPARKDSKGYVMVYEPEHPNKSFKGWQYEHRLVVEKALGRYLASDEHIHHINGTKDDNRLENLQVMDALDHARLSVNDFRDSINRQLEELAEYKRRYGPLKEE